MKWPFGPPHLTPKPSKKNKTKKQNKKTKKEKKEKHKKYKKKAFQLSVNFLVGVENYHFWQLGPKRAHPKNTIKIGVSARFFEMQLCVTKQPFLDQKNPKPEIPVIILYLPFSSLSTTKTTKIGWNPYFYSALANQQKEFSKLKLKKKKQKFENPIFAPFFFPKAIFKKLADNWTQKNTHTENDNWAKQNRLKPLFL